MIRGCCRAFRVKLKHSRHVSAHARHRSSLASQGDHPLRTAFDTPSTSTASTSTTGLFLQPSLGSPDELFPLVHRTTLRSQFIVDRICNDKSSPRNVPEAERDFLRMVKNLDRLSDLLCGVIDLCEVIRTVHTDQDWRECANEAYEIMCERMNELNVHVGLYEALKNLHDKLPPSTFSQSPALFSAHAVAVPFLRDFEKSGIHLPPDQRSRFVDLSSSILQLGRRFLQNTNGEASPPRAQVRVTAEDIGSSLGGFARQVLGGDSYADLDPHSWEARVLARQHPSAALRQKLYVAQNAAPASHVETLEELLRTRAELARLVGRETWADVALEDKMARTPTNVMSFLSALNEHNQPRARKDLESLSRAKRDDVGGDGAIYAWDRDYYSDIAGRSASPLPDISPFFSVGTTFQGLSKVFTSLYGIRFEIEETASGEVWDAHVKKLRVLDEDEGHIGTIYCDLFAREGKGSTAAHFTVRCSRRLDDDDAEGDFEDGRAIIDGVEMDRSELESLSINPVRYRGRPGSHQTPIIVLVCGFGSSAQASDQVSLPAFLHWHEVETLFHEMGHAIHSMIGRTDYHNVAGTRCATDFVELPSILMEHFLASPSVVALASSHISTGRPLPTSILRDLLEERHQFSALETSHQITMSTLDQTYHSAVPLERSFSSTATFADVQSRFGVIPFVKDTAWQTQFGHLFGYGATYYSYLFDRAIAAQIFSKLFARDPLNRESGEKFKQLVLRWGGGKDPWEMIGETVGDDRVARGGRAAMGEVGRWGIEEAARGQ